MVLLIRRPSVEELTARELPIKVWSSLANWLVISIMLQEFTRTKSEERYVEEIFSNSNGMIGKEGNAIIRRDKKLIISYGEKVTLNPLKENEVEKLVVEIWDKAT